MADPEPAPDELQIRQADHASESDQVAIADMLSRRDGYHWSITDTKRVLRGLDPKHCRAWLAFSGMSPVGLSIVFLVQLQIQGTSAPVAYWANLFVDPAQRHTLLYPRMVLATTQGIRSLGAHALLAGVRRRDLSAAHQRLGFVLVDSQVVVAKVLRPLRVGARYFNVSQMLVTMAGWIDRAPAFAFTPPPRTKTNVCPIIPGAPLPESFLGMFSGVAADIAFERNCDWLATRLSSWKGSDPYLAIWVEQNGSPTSGAILAQGTRGNGFLIGVILDLVAPTQAEQKTLLKAIHHLCCRRGDDLVLWLPATSAQAESAQSHGYRSTSERYDILVHPPTFARRIKEPTPLGWAFTFLDHDAF